MFSCSASQDMGEFICSPPKLMSKKEPPNYIHSKVVLKNLEITHLWMSTLLCHLKVRKKFQIMNSAFLI